MPNLRVAAGVLLLLLSLAQAATTATTTTTTTTTPAADPAKRSSRLPASLRGSKRQVTNGLLLADPSCPCTTADFCPQPDGGGYGGRSSKGDFSYGYDTFPGPGGCGDLGFGQKTYSCTTAAAPTPAPTPLLVLPPLPTPAGRPIDDDWLRQQPPTLPAPTTAPTTAPPPTIGGGGDSLSEEAIAGLSLLFAALGVLVALAGVLIGIPACCLALLQLVQLTPP